MRVLMTRAATAFPKTQRSIVWLEAGEIINDICDCGFFSVNTRKRILDRKLISEEQATL